MYILSTNRRNLGKINPFLLKGVLLLWWWWLFLKHTRCILLEVSEILYSLLKLGKSQENLLYMPSYFPPVSIFSTISLLTAEVILICLLTFDICDPTV